MLRSAEDTTLTQQLRVLASVVVPEDLRDDRFDESFAAKLKDSGNRFFAVTHSSANGPDGPESITAFLGGFIDGHELHLDLLVPADSEDPLATAVDLLRELKSILDTEQGLAVQPDVFVWTKPSLGWHDQLAAVTNLAPARALHQMRASLPTALAPVPTRAFVPGEDNEAVRILNNRAFANHPDQGGQSPEQFNEGLDQAWVDPAGIRLFEIDGQLAGFCWTKIHEEPALGEIYVIGIDPEFHGQGYGKPMTAAGLAWLYEQGLETSMLYVEADNHPALATYERLGFTTVRTDKSWRWPIE